MRFVKWIVVSLAVVGGVWLAMPVKHSPAHTAPAVVEPVPVIVEKGADTALVPQTVTLQPESPPESPTPDAVAEVARKELELKLGVYRALYRKSRAEFAQSDFQAYSLKALEDLAAQDSVMAMRALAERLKTNDPTRVLVAGAPGATLRKEKQGLSDARIVELYVNAKKRGYEFGVQDAAAWMEYIGSSSQATSSDRLSALAWSQVACKDKAAIIKINARSTCMEAMARHPASRKLSQSELGAVNDEVAAIERMVYGTSIQ